MDARADIYSLGCTLYFLLTGRPPYPDGTPMDKLFKHQLEPAPMVRDIRPDVPESLGKLLVKLMSKTPDGRPANEAMVAAMLEPFTRYDFRPGRGSDHAIRLPAAPTAARPTAGGHYSLADDASQAGDPNTGKPVVGSSAQMPALSGAEDSGMFVGNPTPTHGPSTSRMERNGVAVLDRPRTAARRKKGRRGRRGRRVRGRVAGLVLIWLVAVVGLIGLVWFLIHNMAKG